ncbi:hypothetical protein HYH03_009555 [Edaphochlamys debaryana]|uniref:THO complex subunit 2 n=1 Tax=Edaphochlamys debaryana TaxID=47281 RepID=A0A836BXJ3_9CHLO|nr:hypothetical protein HYH03_009555 [Edaphochlamys debaryana]|eukprot:KAG2492057.1 hypothetical protein HYH03_009555 [Edaphochlamys debaryana]
MAPNINQALVSVVTKHIQGATFDADKFYKDLEEHGAPATYAEALVDVFWMLCVRFEGTRGPESMNLVAAIKACWQDKKVPDKLLLQVLEPEVLATVGLLRDKGLWDKKAVRYNTRLNYTILKYNLLREDSEGYAKLVTLYNHFGSGAVGEADLPSLARELQSLIGCFDLDPNRCLDLLLDAAAAQPGNEALLWAVELLKAEAVGQLLGFKLQQYQDPSRPPAPRSLFLVAARLVASGRTSLPELLGHLAPGDEAQAAGQRQAREALMKKVSDIGTIILGGPAAGEEAGKDGGGKGGAGERERERGTKGGLAQPIAGRASGLSAAFFDLDAPALLGPLALGPDPGHNQPLALLDALLEVGAWDVATVLHDRLVAQGVSPAAHPAISAALCARLGAEVKPRYEALLPQGVLARTALSGDVPPAASGPAPELTPLALRLLAMLGPYLHRDIRLFTKVVRLARYQLASSAALTAATTAPASAPVSGPTAATSAGLAGPGSLSPEELLSSVLLPGLACCPTHLPLAADVWELVRLLPVVSRYRVYADFRDLSQSHPLLQAAWRLSTVETKKVLKRLVLPTDPQKKKEACRPHARMVAKVAHANPFPVMEAIVTQIEVYDNQIEVSLEALKYLSPLSYDVLTFVILSRLAMERDKVKEDGVNISNWLQGLARFTGAACRRFSDLDVGAILQFLLNTLRQGDAFDLLVLQQIIVAMTGVRLEAVLSEEQLDALSGGPELVAEAVVLDAGEADAALGPGRVASAKDLAKGRQRLLRALEDRPSGGGGSLALPLLILVAQQRSVIINHTDSKLIKFIATMYDRCQDTLLHLSEFLRLALPGEAYAETVPMPDVLRRDFGIDVEVVWHIFRPVLSRLMEAAAPQPAEEGELEEGEEATAPAGAGAEAASAPREELRLGGKTWPGVVGCLRDCVASPGLWALVTPELYATFWGLQLTDIYVPTRRYEKELSVVKELLQVLENNYNNHIRPSLNSSSGYVSSNIQLQYEQYKSEKASLQDKLARLNAELDARRKHVDEVRQRLSLQRMAFFLPRPAPTPAAPAGAAGGGAAAAAVSGGGAAADDDGGQADGEAGGAATAKAGAPGGAAAAAAAAGAKPRVGTTQLFPVVQEMLLPRILFSASDALYCARLTMLLHQLEAKHFNLLLFMDQVFRGVVPVLRTCTEVEAHNLGSFLLEVQRGMMAWHRDEKLFIEECVRKSPPPLSVAKQPHNLFKQKMMVWHGVTSSTFRASLESGDYTQIANALSVMGRIVTVWPGTQTALITFRQLVEKLAKSDPREDIKTMARSYLIALNREAEKPGRMLSALEYGGPNCQDHRTRLVAGGRGAGPAGASPGRGGGRTGAAGGVAAAALAAVAKPLNVAAKPFVPKAEPDGGSGKDKEKGGDKEGAAGAAAPGTARKRQRTDGGDKADGGGGKADAGGADGKGATSVGGVKKQRTDGGAAPTGADRGDDDGDANGADARSDTAGGGGGKGDGGKATSETSGRAREGRDGKGDKEHKEHKRSKEKDKDKERKDKDKEKDKDRKDKDKDKGDDKDKERRREEKDRARADKAQTPGDDKGAGGGGAVPKGSADKGGDRDKERDRDGRGADPRSTSVERSQRGGGGGGAGRDADGGDRRDRASRERGVDRREEDGGRGGDRDGGAEAGGKRRRVESGGKAGGDSPDAGSARRGPDGEVEYDAGGFALPPVPASRAAGGGGGAAASATAAGGGRGGGGAGGLPPPAARSNGAGEGRRRSGR